MKKFLTTTLAIVAMTLAGQAMTSHKSDTVIIKIGNSRIIIQTDSKEELKALSAYDINKMLADLKVSLEGQEGDKTITIEKDGEGYALVGNNEARQGNFSSDTTRRGNVTIKITENKDRNYQWKTAKNGRVSGTENNFLFELGTNNWLEDGKFPSESNAAYTVRPWGSWYVAMGQVNKTSISGPLFLEWGGNISWYNWKFQDDNIRVAKGDNTVSFYEQTELPNPIKSKLTASYLNVSIVPMLDFGYGRDEIEKADGTKKKVTVSKRSGFRIGAGMYAGYRMGSKHKFVYKDGRRNDDKEFSDFYLTNFRYGIRGQVGFRGTDFFVNYDLNDVFAENRGPKMNAVSFGVIF